MHGRAGVELGGFFSQRSIVLVLVSVVFYVLGTVVDYAGSLKLVG